MDDGLRFGPISAAVHICVDMQRLFAEDTPWHTPWMSRIIPTVVQMVRSHPHDTIFTRFIPARRAGLGVGTWKRYYEHWQAITTDVIGLEMLRLLAPLEAYVPPALVIDKHVYSPWQETNLIARLRARDTNTIIVSGAETDVCVLATVLGAIDLGYRVILAKDATCGSADQTHDAQMRVYANRFGMQLETAISQDILENWHSP